MGRRLLPRVQLQGHHPPGQVIAADVLAADTQCALVQLAQHHMALRRVFGQGQTDTARACTQVQHPGLGHGLQVRQRPIHQYLGVRPRDQHALRDIQRQAVELPLADQVRHRLAGQMALRQAAHLLFHRLRHVQPAIPAQRLPGLPGGAAYQLPGLQRGIGQSCPQELLPHVQIQVVICDRHNTYRFHFLRYFSALSAVLRPAARPRLTRCRYPSPPG